MGIKENLNQEINSFFEQAEHQTSSGRKESLEKLFDKYLHLTTSDMLMDEKDLRSIISRAKQIFAEKPMPVHLGKKKSKITQEEMMPMCVIQATTEHFNRIGCLKRLPKFDTTEDSF